VKNTWSYIMRGLKDLNHLEIPRWIGHSKTSITSTEIYVFGDASESAYGAEAEARLQPENGILTPFSLPVKPEWRLFQEKSNLT